MTVGKIGFTVEKQHHKSLTVKNRFLGHITTHVPSGRKIASNYQAESSNWIDKLITRNASITGENLTKFIDEEILPLTERTSAELEFGRKESIAGAVGKGCAIGNGE